MQTECGMLVPRAHGEWAGFKCNHQQDTASHSVLGGLVLESSSPDIQGCSSPLHKVMYVTGEMTSSYEHVLLEDQSSGSVPMFSVSQWPATVAPGKYNTLAPVGI